MENPIKMDDLGVPLFLETPIYNFKEIQLYNWYCLAVLFKVARYQAHYNSWETQHKQNGRSDAAPWRNMFFWNTFSTSI